MTIAVSLFRDFIEDRRWSMEVYADGLKNALEKVMDSHWCLNEYRPTALLWHEWQQLGIRGSRYLAYPLQARRKQGNINHILDHGYSHLLYTLNPQRTVVTVHDVIPLVRWLGLISGLPPKRKPWLNIWSFSALKRANRLIAASENTRRDLTELCGCQPDRITVISYGVDAIFKPYSLEKRLNLRNQQVESLGDSLRVLVMATAPYKNLVGIFNAFTRLRSKLDTPIQLITVNSCTPEWERLKRQFSLEHETVCLNTVPHGKMPDLYNSVDCLLFPSLYEGFGWPPLESMACGTPVVTSNAASLPEVVGDAALMADPQDYDGLADALYRLLTNTQLRQSMIERGLKRASQFTWERTAIKTLEVYKQVMSDEHVRRN